MVTCFRGISRCCRVKSVGFQELAEQSLKVVHICINTSNPNAQQAAAVRSVVFQATYTQLPPLKWQRLHES